MAYTGTMNRILVTLKRVSIMSSVHDWDQHTVFAELAESNEHHAGTSVSRTRFLLLLWRSLLPLPRARVLSSHDTLVPQSLK